MSRYLVSVVQSICFNLFLGLSVSGCLSALDPVSLSETAMTCSLPICLLLYTYAFLDCQSSEVPAQAERCWEEFEAVFRVGFYPGSSFANPLGPTQGWIHRQCHANI